MNNKKTGAFSLKKLSYKLYYNNSNHWPTLSQIVHVPFNTTPVANQKVNRIK
jgi:hypothetical protein